MQIIEYKKSETILDLIALMKNRTGMYIGEYKISAMRSFIDGYHFFASTHDIAIKEVFPQFWYFHEWAMHKYDWGESTAGWKNIILSENGNDEAKALDVFFEMIDEFKTLKPIKLQKMRIGAENLAYHLSSDYVARDGEGNPIYDDLDEVLLVEFSHDFGHSYFMLKDNKIMGSSWTTRYKKDASAKKSLAAYFGESSKWETLSGDLLDILNKLVVNSTF